MSDDLFQKKKSNEEEVRALAHIARHALVTAGAVLNDVAAARRGLSRGESRSIALQSVGQYQAAPSGGASYVMLGRLSPKGIDYADMIILFQFHGDAALFRMVFASDEMTAAYFGQTGASKEAEAMQLQFERFYLRGLQLGANFGFAAALHKKGYLGKIFKGDLASAETEDCRKLVDVVGKDIAGFMAMGREVSTNPDRFQKMIEECPKDFNLMPVVVQMKAEACRLMNEIWIETGLAEKLTNHLAELQARGMVRRAS